MKTSNILMGTKPNLHHKMAASIQRKKWLAQDTYFRFEFFMKMHMAYTVSNVSDDYHFIRSYFVT